MALEATTTNSTVDAQPSVVPCPPQKRSRSLNSTGRQQDALVVYDPSGLPMPEGWLSAKELELDSRIETLRICHACGENLLSEDRCSNCGHDFCFKCATQIPETGACPSHIPRTESGRLPESRTGRWLMSDDNMLGSDGASRSHQLSCGFSHPHLLGSEDGLPGDAEKQSVRERSKELPEIDVRTPTGLPSADANSGSAVRDNPFFKADLYARVAASTPKSVPQNKRARNPRRLSDRVARRLPHSSSIQPVNQEQSSDLRSDADDYYVQGARHSICCAAHRGLAKQSTNDELGKDEEEERPLGEVQERKIDQLYRHAEKLHNSRLVARHHASAPVDLGCSSESDQDHSNVSVISFQSSNFTTSKHPHERSLEQDERTPVSSPSRKHDSQEDLAVSTLSPLRSRCLDADDVFGPPESLSSPDSAPDQQSHGMSSSSQTPTTKNNLVQRPVLRSPLWGVSSRHQWSAIEVRDTSQPRSGDGSLKSSITHSEAVSEGSAGKDSIVMLNLPILQRMRSIERCGKSTSPSSQVFRPHSAGQSPQIASSAAHATGRDIPSITGYLRHRQDTILCLPSQDSDPMPEPWPCLRTVDRSKAERPVQTPDSVPWSRVSLKRVPTNIDSVRQTHEAPTPSAWRIGLGKGGERDQASPVHTTAPLTPASQWRQILTKAPDAPSIQPERRANICSFCDPNPTSSPLGDVKNSGGCNHVNTPQANAQAEQVEFDDSATASRLKVRQVEHSLALKQAEEEMEEEARRAKRIAHTSTNDTGQLAGRRRGMREKKEFADDLSPDEHSCVWRDLYTDLSLQIQKRESELRSCDGSDEALRDEQPTRRDKGVGANLSQCSAAGDVGIEGLTIVVHMRYKDDLVISTKLEGEGPTSS